LSHPFIACYDIVKQCWKVCWLPATHMNAKNNFHGLLRPLYPKLNGQGDCAHLWTLLSGTVNSDGWLIVEQHFLPRHLFKPWE
jgi:hypothetical protein